MLIIIQPELRGNSVLAVTKQSPPRRTLSSSTSSNVSIRLTSDSDIVYRNPTGNSIRDPYIDIATAGRV